MRKKKVLSNLEKCYSIAPLKYNNNNYLLVAAEKKNRCILFDLDGNEIDTVWNEPGGVMTMVQVPNSNGQFLATHQFYSPNDSLDAKIVIVTPLKSGEWEVRTLVELPFVHRFDILETHDKNYFIACTLKSGHKCKDDWSSYGKVYCAQLPEDLEPYNSENQLELTILKDNMLKNHGYYHTNTKNGVASLISCEQGVFLFRPPTNKNHNWEIEQLLDIPSSDATLVDLDGDGEKELVVLSPFHGEKISIYKKQNKTYKIVYEYPYKADFTHAIWSGLLCGKPSVLVGHRGGEQKLLAFTYDNGNYIFKVIDTGCGPANVLKFEHKNKEYIVATNREIDEVALYNIEENIWSC